MVITDAPGKPVVRVTPDSAVLEAGQSINLVCDLSDSGKGV